MEYQVRKASKKRARLRLAIDGQTNGGKTYSSILVSKHLIGEPLKLPEGQDSRICVIDSERNSAENYQDLFDFDVVELSAPNHGPKDYVAALRTAERDHDVVILDSISHEWAWVLAEADKLGLSKFRGNKWAAWSDLRPAHDAFIDAMMGSKAHIIATMRAKMATVQEQDGGRTVVRNVGMESKQDDMIAYAFSVVMRMDQAHNGVIVKTRCPELDGMVFEHPGRDFALKVKTWLESGSATDVAVTLDDAIKQGVGLAVKANTDDEKKAAWKAAKDFVVGWCKGRGRSKEEADDAIKTLTARVVEARKGSTGNGAPSSQNGAAHPGQAQ